MGGARGTRGALAPPYFGLKNINKKESWKEVKLAGQATKKPPPLPLLAQGLDPPLVT